MGCMVPLRGPEFYKTPVELSRERHFERPSSSDWLSFGPAWVLRMTPSLLHFEVFWVFHR
jgi:hypothetical protein